MKADIVELTGTSTLAGTLQGKRLFSLLSDGRFEHSAEPAALFLDFSGIEIATASYLRESVLRFKNHMRTSKTTVYPVLANANESVLEEAAVVIDATNDALLACRLDQANEVSEVQLLGKLDPKQRMTLSVVNQAKRADASSLMKQFGAQEKTTRTTAWNNRLAALSSRGLIREISEGRSKHYVSMFDEVTGWA